MICFQISIFDPLETAGGFIEQVYPVVICFQISIFDPLETAYSNEDIGDVLL